MPQEAQTSFTVSDTYRQFAGQAQLLKSESRSHIEYLIPTNNIIVLYSYFILTNKSNLIDRLLCDSKQFVDHLIVAYFLGHPVGFQFVYMYVRSLTQYQLTLINHTMIQFGIINIRQFFCRRRTVPPAMPIVLYLASCFSPRDLYYNFISSYHRKWRHVEPLGRRTYPGNRQTSRNNHWGTQVKRGCFDAEYRRRHCNRFLAVCCIQNPVPAAWCLQDLRYILLMIILIITNKKLTC